MNLQPQSPSSSDASTLLLDLQSLMATTKCCQESGSQATIDNNLQTVLTAARTQLDSLISCKMKKVGFCESEKNLHFTISQALQLVDDYLGFEAAVQTIAALEIDGRYVTALLKNAQTEGKSRMEYCAKQAEQFWPSIFSQAEYVLRQLVTEGPCEA